MERIAAPSSVIRRIGWRTWTGDLAISLHWTRRSVRIAVWVAAIGGLAMSAMLCAMVLVAFGGIAPTTEIDRSPFAGLAFSGVLLASVVVHTLNAAVSPTTDVLQSLVQRLPVPRAAAAWGLMQPQLLVGTFVAFCLAAPSITMLCFVVWPTGGSGVAILLSIILLIVSGLGTVGAMRAIRSFLSRVVRLPRMYGTACAVVSVLLVGLTLALPGLALGSPTFDEFGASQFAPGYAMTQILLSTDKWALGWAVSIAWVALALALFFFGIQQRQLGDERLATRLLVGLTLPTNRYGALTVSQLLIVMRLPQYAVLALLAVLGIFATWLAGMSELPGVQLAGVAFAPALLAVPFSIGMYAFGTTRSLTNVVSLVPIRRPALRYTLFLSTLLAPLPVVAIVAVIGFLTGQLSPLGLAEGLSAGLALSITATLVGSLVPYEPRQALSATVTSIAALGTYGALTIAVGWVSGELGITTTLVASAVVMSAAGIGAALWSRGRLLVA